MDCVRPRVSYPGIFVISAVGPCLSMVIDLRGPQPVQQIALIAASFIATVTGIFLTLPRPAKPRHAKPFKLLQSITADSAWTAILISLNAVVLVAILGIAFFRPTISLVFRSGDNPDSITAPRNFVPSSPSAWRLGVDRPAVAATYGLPHGGEVPKPQYVTATVRAWAYSCDGKVRWSLNVGEFQKNGALVVPPDSKFGLSGRPKTYVASTDIKIAVARFDMIQTVKLSASLEGENRRCEIDVEFSKLTLRGWR